MKYTIRLSKKAEETLRRWPAPLRASVEQQLQRLSAAPTKLSRASVSPPYPPGCQMFQPPPCNFGGASHEFTILFKFSQDETSLHILGIGHIERSGEE